MPADAVLSRELKSLQDEIATSQRARASLPPDIAMASNPEAISAVAAIGTESAEDGGEEKLQNEFREFIEEVTKFFNEAENNIAAHPAASVVGALVVGILIGRLLAHR